MKTTSHLANRSSLDARHMSTHAAGFTLVEVVVALAIFVIGALAIVRIFPPSLGVIQNAGDRTTAANLSRDVLARHAAEPGLVPDAIYDEQYKNYGVYNDFQGAVIGSANKNSSLPKTRDEEDVTGTGTGVSKDTTGTALGHFRRIVGERHTVLQDSAGNNYILTGYPYAVDENPATPNKVGNPKSLEVYVEDRVNGVRVDDNGYLDFREARLASDNSSFFDASTTPAPGGDIRRPPYNMRGSDGVTYYVSYRWKKTIGGIARLQGVMDEPLFFRSNSITFAPVIGASTPANTEQVFQGRSLGKNVIGGNVDVRFTRRISITPTGATVGGMDSLDASFRGIFYLGTDPSAVAGKTVMVNYTARDWRWMVDDAAPAQAPIADKNYTPSANDTRRTLPIRYLNDENPLPPDQADAAATPSYVYSLLTSNPTTVAGIPDETKTNAVNAGRWSAASTASGPILSHVNSKLSQVTYNLSGANTVAPRVRTVYWTLDGWAVQPTVAARDYLPYEAARPLVESEPWRDYFWNSDTASPNLYFHWGDAGKTVAVTYQYQYIDASGAVKTATATGTFTINDRDEPAPSFIPSGPTGPVSSGKVVSVTLADPSGTPFYDPPVGGKQVVGILSVRGLSVRARTAWMDNGRYTQSTSAGYRPQQ